MILWQCKNESCRHEVVATEKPSPYRWKDGHVCYFEEAPVQDIEDDDYGYEEQGKSFD